MILATIQGEDQRSINELDLARPFAISGECSRDCQRSVYGCSIQGMSLSLSLFSLHPPTQSTLLSRLVK